MTEEYTRAATWQDVIQVARYLNEAGAVYVLVGGYALIAQGLNRTSEDIDILVRPDADNGKRSGNYRLAELTASFLILGRGTGNTIGT